MRELRRDQRELTLKTGKITTSGSGAVIDCAILNMSASGACLLVSDGAALPQDFHLAIDFTGALHECRVAWRTQHRVGVSFKDRMATPSSD